MFRSNFLGSRGITEKMERHDFSHIYAKMQKVPTVYINLIAVSNWKRHFTLKQTLKWHFATILYT